MDGSLAEILAPLRSKLERIGLIAEDEESSPTVLVVSIDAGGNSDLEQPEVRTGSSAHQCPKCSRQFPCKSHLDRHWKVHTGERPYSCPVCDRKFNQESNCQRHQQIHLRQGRTNKRRSGRKGSGHSSKTMPLGQDDKAKETKEDGSQLLVDTGIIGNQMEGELCEDRNLRDACRQPKSFCKLSLRPELGQCCSGAMEDCEEVNEGAEGERCRRGKEQIMDKTGKEREHEVCQEEHEPHGLTIICPLCGLAFSAVSSLDQHIKGQHPNETITVDLPSSSVNPSRKAIGSSGSDFQCLQCGRSFYSRSNLKKHMLVHSGRRPYSCPDCGKTFNQSGNALRHQRSHHHGHFKLTSKEARNKRREASRQTLTKTCPTRKRSQSQRVRVIRTESTDPEDLGSTAGQPSVHVQFLCYVCGHGFQSQSSLEIHEQSHRKELAYRCIHCGRGFAHVQNFSRHLLVHTGEKPWHCRDCGRRFNQASNLNRHCRTQGHQGAAARHTGK